MIINEFLFQLAATVISLLIAAWLTDKIMEAIFGKRDKVKLMPLPLQYIPFNKDLVLYKGRIAYEKIKSGRVKRSIDLPNEDHVCLRMYLTENPELLKT